MELQLLTLLIGVVIPVLVGLVTKASWPAGSKAVLLLTLSAVGGWLAEVLAAGGFGSGFAWRDAAFNAALAWVVAVATYFGLYKPTGVTKWAQRTLVADGDPNDARIRG